MTDPGGPEEKWRELLECGDVEVLGRMPWSSNATYLVIVGAGAEASQAVYKPGRGERPLWDFPGGLYRREVAAYELSASTGLAVVPMTVVRRDGPLGTGSLQRFVDADFSEHYFTLLESGDRVDQLRRIAGFDLLANNADRKGGHLLLDAAGHVWGIDNGLCFHEDPKLRTVMWDFADEELPGDVRDACARVADEVPGTVAALLEDEEIDALRTRAAALAAAPRFPRPREDHRAYPWPLV